MKQALLTILFFITSIFCFSQNEKIDSLLKVLKTAKDDTSKVNDMNFLSRQLFLSSDLDGSMAECNKAYNLALKLKYKRGMAVSLQMNGILYKEHGDYAKALDCQLKSLKIAEEINSKKDIANAENGMGGIYVEQANYPAALEHYLKSLKLREDIKSDLGIAASQNNIGSVYQEMGENDKALEYYFKSLKTKEKINDKIGIQSSLNNIGNVYFYNKDYIKALEYYNRALKLCENTNNKRMLSTAYNNLGGVYNAQENYEKALFYYFKTLSLRKEIDDKQGIAYGLDNIATVYIKQKKYNDALLLCLEGLKIAKDIGSMDDVKNAENNLSTIYSKLNQPEKALVHYKNYIAARDSIFNEENTAKTVRSEMNFEFDKIKAVSKAEQDKKDGIQKEEARRQRTVRNAILTGLVLMILLALVIFRSFKQKQKANKLLDAQKNEIEQKNAALNQQNEEISAQRDEIEKQKEKVEEHQKEMVDSINYAKRIQYSLLANKTLLEKNLPEHFVLFKPKDIVSGDFYWATQRNNKFYFAACDSTGHGVPGAFMSLLNISFLNEAVNEKNIFEPHEILNHVRKRLMENMEGGQDGMDAVLICIETSPSTPLHKRGENTRFTYAAANNAPSIIKNGKLTSLPTDKMPVGKGEKTESFTLRNIDLQKGDSLYLYTDGYADQFGGPKGKKFKYKQLDELLISNSNLALSEQSEILNKKFEEWKGFLEQVDDVLVVGIKV